MYTACQVNDPEKRETESTRSLARRAALILVLASLASAPSAATPQVTMTKYLPFEVKFTTGLTAGGVPLTETTPSPNNPWLDYRCDVTFTHVNGTTHVVPGYYAGDGNFGSSGSVWAARFAPFGANALGTWTYSAQIWKSANANITPKSSPPGSPSWASGPSGSVTCVAPAGLDSKFLRHGFLRATGDRYLEFEDPSGGHFLMTGAGSPENFLASDHFTGWASGPGNDCFGNPALPQREVTGHDYDFHELTHWTMSDPSWGAGGLKGRGLIGAINYLYLVRANSLYLMTMNLGGDGRDVFPFSAPGFYINPCAPDPTSTVFHYSVPRMREWNIVFEHAMRKEVLLNIVLAEREEGNIRWLGGAQSTGGTAMSPERKLYLKQMVAFFAHNVAIKWNLCEENYPSGMNFTQFNSVELRDLAEWLGSWDIYDHPRTVHTEANGFSAYQDLLASANDDWLDVTSLQVHGENQSSTASSLVTRDFSTSYSYFAQQARKLFATHANGGRTVVVDIDENGSGGLGVAPESGTSIPGWAEADRDDRRKRILYDVLFAGANLSWYFGNYALTTGGGGGGDINVNRFDTRNLLFKDTWYARNLLEMPDVDTYHDLFVAMQPWDEVVPQSGAGTGQIMGSAPAGFQDAVDVEGLDKGAYDGEFGRPRVFAKMDGRVLVHYPNLHDFGPYTVNLGLVRSATPPSSYTSYWFNPRTGDLVGPRTVIQTNFSSHVPPLPATQLVQFEDWVYVIEVNQ